MRGKNCGSSPPDTRRTSEIYRQTFGQAGVGIVHLGLDGRIIRANPAFCRLVGRSVDELVGQDDASITHPDDIAGDRAAAEEATAAGVPSVAREKRYLFPGGEPVWVEVTASVVRDSAGLPVYLLCFLHETRRRRAEAEAARWAHLFEHASWGVGVSDATGRWIAAVNPAFAAMHGYEVEELVGTAVVDLYPEAVRDEFRRQTRVAEHLGQHSFRSMHVRKDGSEFPVEVSVSVVRDQSGAFLYRGAHVQDITRELDLQRRLEQSHRMEALGVLAGGIAHDFNNILTGVVGYAELVKLAVSPTSREASDLSELLRAALRGKELVQQILTFSRRAETRKARIDFPALAVEAHKLLRAAIPTTIPVGLSLPDSCPPIHADATQLHQVIMNLGTNAFQALRVDGGRIDLAVEVVGTPEGQSGTDRERPRIRLTVSDTGHGMDEGTLARAFEPFYTTRGLGEGTGMGLAVVHGIVRDHDGTVEIESEPGIGTRVVVTLPCADVVSHVAEVTDATSGRGSEHVLLVDDEENIAIVVARMVEALGYRVTTFVSPASALAYVHGGQPVDVVITDQTMPGMTGTALTDAVHAVRPDLPVILCSGDTDAMTPEEARALGISALLWKPVQIHVLGSAIRGVLGDVQHG